VAKYHLLQQIRSRDNPFFTSHNNPSHSS